MTGLTGYEQVVTGHVAPRLSFKNPSVVWRRDFCGYDFLFFYLIGSGDLFDLDLVASFVFEIGLGETNADIHFFGVGKVEVINAIGSFHRGDLTYVHVDADGIGFAVGGRYVL